MSLEFLTVYSCLKRCHAFDRKTCCCLSRVVFCGVDKRAIQHLLDQHDKVYPKYQAFWEKVVINRLGIHLPVDFHI